MTFLYLIKNSLIYVATSPYIAVKNVYNFFHNKESPPKTMSYLSTWKEFFYWKYYKNQYLKEIQTIAKHETMLELLNNRPLNFNMITATSYPYVLETTRAKLDQIKHYYIELTETHFFLNSARKKELLEQYTALQQKIISLDIPAIEKESQYFSEHKSHKTREIGHTYDKKVKDIEERTQREREASMQELLLEQEKCQTYEAGLVVKNNKISKLEEQIKDLTTENTQYKMDLQKERVSTQEALQKQVALEEAQSELKTTITRLERTLEAESILKRGLEESLRIVKKDCCTIKTELEKVEAKSNKLFTQNKQLSEEFTILAELNGQLQSLETIKVQNLQAKLNGANAQLAKEELNYKANISVIEESRVLLKETRKERDTLREWNTQLAGTDKNKLLLHLEKHLEDSIAALTKGSSIIQKINSITINLQQIAQSHDKLVEYRKAQYALEQTILHNINEIDGLKENHATELRLLPLANPSDLEGARQSKKARLDCELEHLHKKNTEKESHLKEYLTLIEKETTSLLKWKTRVATLQTGLDADLLELKTNISAAKGALETLRSPPEKLQDVASNSIDSHRKVAVLKIQQRAKKLTELPQNPSKPSLVQQIKEDIPKIINTAQIEHKFTDSTTQVD